MRILCTYMGGSGHLAPLAPVARAMADAGHEVAFLAQPFTAPLVEAAGFRSFSAPSHRDDPGYLAMWQQAAAIATIAEREDFLLRESFARLNAGWQADAVLELCDEYQPDLIIRDEADFGSAVAAEKLSIPMVVVLVIAAGSLMRHAIIGEPLHALRARHGLGPDPALTMLNRNLVLSPFPPTFRDPAFPLPERGVSLRPYGWEPRPSDQLPGWVADMREHRPLRCTRCRPGRRRYRRYTCVHPHRRSGSYGQSCLPRSGRALA